MKYKLVSHVSKREFQKMVTEALQQGWRLYGQPQITLEPNPNGGQDLTVFYQAMVQYPHESKILFQNASIANPLATTPS